MPHPTPFSFNLDLVRASLGPAIDEPYQHAFGAVPWLTAGTLAWPAGGADEVLTAWRRWTETLRASVLTAIRIGACEIAIDVAVVGDPWHVPGRLAALRGLAPTVDTVALVSPRTLRSPPSVGAAAVALPGVPSTDALLRAAGDAPDGICLGLRRMARSGVSLIGVGAVADLPRAQAAVDQAARGLDGRAETSAAR